MCSCTLRGGRNEGVLWSSGILGYYGNNVEEVSVWRMNNEQKCEYPLQFSVLVYEKVCMGVSIERVASAHQEDVPDERYGAASSARAPPSGEVNLDCHVND